MMKSIKITALTDLGGKGLEEMKQQCARMVVQFALRKLKTKVSFTDNSVTIENPAFQFCENLDHVKSQEGIKQIRKAFSEIEAKEGIDYKIEEVKDV